MKVTVTTEQGLLTAVVSGRFDAHAIQGFDQGVVNAIDGEHHSVIIDMADVEFMDSSALASLVRALKATIAVGGSVTLVNISDAARIILELTRLDAVFETAPSMSDARSRVIVEV